MNNTLDIIKNILIEHFGISQEIIKPDSLLYDDFNLSELEIHDFIVHLEQKFNLDLTEEEIKNNNLTQITEIIDDKADNL